MRGKGRKISAKELGEGGGKWERHKQGKVRAIGPSLRRERSRGTIYRTIYWSIEKGMSKRRRGLREGRYAERVGGEEAEDEEREEEGERQHEPPVLLVTPHTHQLILKTQIYNDIDIITKLFGKSEG